MKSEIKIITPKGAAVITFGLVSGIIAVAFMFMFPVEILWASRAAITIGSVAALAKLYFWAKNQQLMWDTKKAQLDAAQLQSKFLVLSSGQTAINANHEIVFTPQRKPAAIESGAVDVVIDSPPYLLDVMKSWTMPLVVNGPQQSGKTNDTIAVAHSLELPTIMVSLRDEQEYHYSGMDIYSEERRKGSIAKGFQACIDMLGNYDPMILILDDFINLGLMLTNDKQLELLIATIATQAVSHKKRVFFTMQSNSKGDFGLKRLGAGLKQNFALLEVPAPLKDNDMNIISRAKIGMLCEAGDWKSGRDVRLPGKVEFKAKAIKTKNERIAEMIRARASDYAIAMEIFGNRNDKIYADIQGVRKTLSDEPD